MGVFTMLGAGGVPWSVLAQGTTTGATATKSGVTGKTLFATGIAGFSDADCTITIEDGGTALVEFELDVSVDGKNFSIPLPPLPGTPGSDLTGVITTSTSTDCAITLIGYTVP